MNHFDRSAMDGRLCRDAKLLISRFLDFLLVCDIFGITLLSLTCRLHLPSV